MNLSEHSSKVVGFDSTWDRDKQVLVQDAATDVMSLSLQLLDKFTSTNDSKEVGIQATPVVVSNSSEDTDKKLACWLRKIMPELEKELSEGLTPVYGNNSEPFERPLKVEEYQDISLKHHFKSIMNFSDDDLNKGSATWLSVSTQDSPVLALSCSLKHDSQNTSFVVVLEPRRSKTDAKIYWHELESVPVREAIEFLVTNPHNRDMFAGASAVGDLYVWSYHNLPIADNELRVSELFSKTSEDSIVALTFLSNNRLLCCLNDGKIIVYKVINKQSTIVDKIMKIEPRNVKDPIITCIVIVPESEDDFVVGLFNGALFYCSTNQLMPQDGSFNPIARELQSHKFAISSLRHCLHNNKSFIVSCDLSGEIYFHDIEDNLDKQPKLVIKMPLPLKNKIAVRKNMKHIFSLLEKGSLEVFKTSSSSCTTLDQQSIVEGKLDGTGKVIELSRNDSWLVTGVFNGTFKIFHLACDD